MGWLENASLGHTELAVLVEVLELENAEAQLSWLIDVGCEELKSNQLSSVECTEKKLDQMYLFEAITNPHDQFNTI